MAEVRERLGLSKGEARDFLNVVLECVTDTLVRGEDVMISGFGKFQVRAKLQREGRHFQTGEKVIIKERKVVTFKASNKLRKAVNIRKENN
ncbi:MAG: integration host factor subunit alpha [Deltaproteobacteria bacterium]|nr:MAG: integration host factor subunit alpha [Deltaproteobacteria bacterium]